MSLNSRNLNNIVCPKCKGKMLKGKLTKMFYDYIACYMTYKYICQDCKNIEEYTETR
jgi:translation elongation factor EF-Ts